MIECATNKQTLTYHEVIDTNDKQKFQLRKVEIRAIWIISIPQRLVKFSNLCFPQRFLGVLGMNFLIGGESVASIVALAEASRLSEIRERKRRDSFYFGQQRVS